MRKEKIGFRVVMHSGLKWNATIALIMIGVEKNSKYRTTKPGPRKFQLKIKKQIWDKIK